MKLYSYSYTCIVAINRAAARGLNTRAATNVRKRCGARFSARVWACSAAPQQQGQEQVADMRPRCMSSRGFLSGPGAARKRTTQDKKKITGWKGNVMPRGHADGRTDQRHLSLGETKRLPTTTATKSHKIWGNFVCI